MAAQDMLNNAGCHNASPKNTTNKSADDTGIQGSRGSWVQVLLTGTMRLTVHCSAELTCVVLVMQQGLSASFLLLGSLEFEPACHLS